MHPARPQPPAWNLPKRRGCCAGCTSGTPARRLPQSGQTRRWRGLYMCHMGRTPSCSPQAVRKSACHRRHRGGTEHSHRTRYSSACQRYFRPHPNRTAKRHSCALPCLRGSANRSRVPKKRRCTVVNQDERQCRSLPQPCRRSRRRRRLSCRTGAWRRQIRARAATGRRGASVRESARAAAAHWCRRTHPYSRPHNGAEPHPARRCHTQTAPRNRRTARASGYRSTRASGRTYRQTSRSSCRCRRAQSRC